MYDSPKILKIVENYILTSPAIGHPLLYILWPVWWYGTVLRLVDTKEPPPLQHKYKEVGGA